MARVVKLTGYGDKRMRQAMEQGLVAGDLRRDMEDVAEENERLKMRVQFLEGRCGELENRCNDETKVRIARYDAKTRGIPLSRDFKFIGWTIVLASAMVTITVASVILWGVGL